MIDTLALETQDNEWQQLFLSESTRYVDYWINFIEKNSTDHLRLDIDQENILHALQLAQEKSYDNLFARGAIAISNYMDARSSIAQGKFNLELAEKGARLLGNQELLAQVLKVSAAMSIRNGLLDRAESLINECFTLLDINKASRLLSGAYRARGLLKFYRANYAEAEHDYKKSLQMAKEFDDRWAIAGLNTNLGLLFLNQTKYDQAYQYLQEAIQMAALINASKLHVSALINVAVILINKGDFSEAESVNLEALSLSQEHEYKEPMAYALNNLGEIAILNQSFAQAERYLNQALELAQEINQYTVIGAAAATLSKITLQKNEFSETEYYLQIAEEAIQHSGDSSVLCTINSQKGALYLQKNELTQAKDAYKQSIELGQKINAFDKMAEALFGLAKVAHSMGNLEEAHRLGTESLDTIKNIQSHLNVEITSWVNSLETS